MLGIETEILGDVETTGEAPGVPGSVTGLGAPSAHAASASSPYNPAMLTSTSSLSLSVTGGVTSVSHTIGHVTGTLAATGPSTSTGTAIKNVTTSAEPVSLVTDVGAVKWDVTSDVAYKWVCFTATMITVTVVGTSLLVSGISEGLEPWLFTVAVATGGSSSLIPSLSSPALLSPLATYGV